MRQHLLINCDRIDRSRFHSPSMRCDCELRCLCSVQLRAWMCCTARARARRKVGHRAPQPAAGWHGSDRWWWYCMHAPGGVLETHSAWHYRGDECCHMLLLLLLLLSVPWRGSQPARCLLDRPIGCKAVPLFRVIAISTCSDPAATRHIGMEMIRVRSIDRSCLR